MRVTDALKQINLYPIQPSVIDNACEERGLDPLSEATKEVRASREYRLAYADICKWLGHAPNSVSQGGVTFQISDKDKQSYLNEAEGIYEELGEGGKVIYGYKGSRL